jgi:hypothetical protein
MLTKRLTGPAILHSAEQHGSRAIQLVKAEMAQGQTMHRDLAARQGIASRRMGVRTIRTALPIGPEPYPTPVQFAEVSHF